MLNTTTTPTTNKIKIDTRHLIENPHYGYQTTHTITDITTTEGWHGKAYHDEDGNPFYGLIESKNGRSTDWKEFHNLSEAFHWLHWRGYTSTPQGTDPNSPEALNMTPVEAVAYLNEQKQKAESAAFERGVLKTIKQGSPDIVDNHPVIYYDENDCKVYAHDNDNNTRLRVAVITYYDITKNTIINLIQSTYSKMIQSITDPIERAVYGLWHSKNGEMLPGVTAQLLGLTYQDDGLALAEKYADYGRVEWIDAYIQGDKIILSTEKGPNKTEEPEGIYCNRYTGYYSDTLTLDERAEWLEYVSQKVAGTVLDIIQTDINNGTLSDLTKQTMTAMAQHEETKELAYALMQFYGIEQQGNTPDPNGPQWPEDTTEATTADQHNTTAPSLTNTIQNIAHHDSEKGGKMDDTFMVEVCEPIEKELYTITDESTYAPQPRLCQINMWCRKIRTMTRVGRTITPGECHLSCSAMITPLGHEPPLRADHVVTISTPIGDNAYVMTTDAMYKMSPEVDNVEAIRHLSDRCIQQLCDMFAWNGQDEQNTIYEACVKAKEKLLAELTAMFNG
jgi:hypothetical protein